MPVQGQVVERHRPDTRPPVGAKGGRAATMTREEVISSLRQRRRIRARELAISCDSTRAVAYRDLLDLYLSGCGVSHWDWVDGRGRREPGQKPRAALRALSNDLVHWPALYSRHARRVTELATARCVRGRLITPGRALFLRTDHWFNLRSGGSVGHLQGVITALRELAVDTPVLSSDYLAGVPVDSRFDLCEPQYRLGRNLPSMPELAFNDQVVEFADSRWANWAPGFIYQRYSLANYAGVALKARYGVPYVCEYNGSFPWVARHWSRRRLFHERLINEIELLNLHAADVIVVVSRPLLEELQERGIEAAKVLVNPNGVDPERYSPRVDGSGVRTRLGLEGKTVIGFIGTFGPWHGAEVLTDAFVQLMRGNRAYQDRVRLLMIGEGPTLQLCRDSLAAAGLLDCCVFTGQVPQEAGPSHLAACDILASPHVPNADGSRFFGSPTKLFEYMAMGRPIVASALEQVAEVLRHDATGWLVPPADTVALAEGLLLLVDDPDRCRRLGQGARAEAIARYTWREHTRRILAKLQERCG
jgi:glycosyltransferase involved in cell wall biosynthesis